MWGKVLVTQIPVEKGMLMEGTQSHRKRKSIPPVLLNIVFGIINHREILFIINDFNHLTFKTPLITSKSIKFGPILNHVIFPNVKTCFSK